MNESEFLFSEIVSSYQVQNICCRRFLHFYECEEFFTRVLNACAEKIYCVVDNKKTVVSVAAKMNCYWRVLGVETVDCQLQIRGYLLCVYCGYCALCSFTKHSEDGFVYIVVDKHY